MSTVAGPGAKVDAMAVEEEPQPTQSPALLRQNLSLVNLPTLAKLVEEQSRQTEPAALLTVTLFAETGLKDPVARLMASVVKQQLTAAKVARADPARVLQWYPRLAHRRHQQIPILVL